MKTLEFVNSRRPDLEMRQSFLRQIQMYENRLAARGLGPKSKEWNELSDTATYHLENDELILRNTYLNSQCGPMNVNDLSGSIQFQRANKLQWRDLASNNQKLLWEENRD